LENICEEKHKRVDERLDYHDTQIGTLTIKVDNSIIKQTRFDERLEGLVKQLESLNANMRWFIIVVGGLLVTNIWDKLF